MSAYRSSLFVQRGGGGGGRPPGTFGKDVEAELHRDNDQLIEGISVDMSRLKAAAQGLRDEAAEHNKLLDALQGAMTTAKDGVKSTVGKLDSVMARYGFKDTLTCTAVIFLLFIVLYLALKHWPASPAEGIAATGNPST